MRINKTCLILPYFGKFNSYFQLWINSCKENMSIDWYIFTDDRTEYQYPNNVYVTYCDFFSVKEKIIKLFGKNALIEKPYDLCKYKVVYHKLFPDVVKRYLYWGYCDCDLIWGNISKAIEEPISKRYDKISWKGHFTLFKNVEEVSDIYAKEISGNTTFRNCISLEKEKTYNLFDEVGINKNFDFLGKTTFKDLLFADLKVKPYNFICNHFSEKENYKNINQIFEWDNGILYRVYTYNGQIFKEEFTYVHFLRRDMENCLSSNTSSHYLIIPNKFIDFEELSVDKIIAWSTPHFYWNFYRKRLKWNYLKKKLFSLLSGEGRLQPDEYLHIIK